MSAAALNFTTVVPIATDDAARRTPGRPLDDGLFEAFYRATAAKLWAYLHRLTGDAAATDDLLQKSYIRFLRTSAVFESDEHMRRYLFRVATNVAFDHLRESSRRREVRLGDDGAAHDVFPDGDLRRDLMRAFGELKPRDRALLWLAHVEGSTHEEIAAALGVGPKSVRVLLFRARKKLESLLKGRGLAPEAER
ncbi:MAG TPA: sigma-70 family RNA polymerase sigma factor [Thermoanaerobaculia bacterium]|nr:sigma-70 family RNA polymerase sigma factor [Thermoanaerobaculia bacterium]